jgi:phosphate transport system substrate-binding protein
VVTSRPFRRGRNPYSLAALLVAVAMLSACGAPAAPSPAVAPPGGGVVIRMSGSGSALPLVKILADAYAASHDGLTFEISDGTNSGGAISGVLAGTIDLAVTNRELSAEERAQPLAYHSFARDAVVFAVPRPNRVAGVSTQELRAIYGGSVTDWRQLGGDPGPIIVLDRDADESMRKNVLIEIMGDRFVGARSVVLVSSSELVDALSSTPGSIGYSSLGLLRVLRPDDVATLRLDGVTPGSEAVASGAYPWSMTFGLALRDDAPASVADFVAWVQSAAGRRVIESFDVIALPE